MSEKEVDDYTVEYNKSDGGGWGVRHLFTALSTSALCVFYITRNTLNIAIVAMVGTANSTDISDNNTDVCPLPHNPTSNQSYVVEGEFDWNEETQGIILGSFFYGYVVGNFLGGIVADALGGRVLIGVCGAVTSVLSIVSPICARTSVILFIAVRVLSGIAQGPLYPGVYSLMSTWVPPYEKASLCSIVLVGSHLGTVICTALGGIMASSDFMGGWPSIFYVFGIIGLCWSVIWIILIRDHPQKHPWISKKEIQYIEVNTSKSKSTGKLQIPWLDIMKSPPFLSLLVFSIGDGMGFFSLLVETPTYLSDIQHFDIASNGLLSALPYVFIILFSPAYGYIADLMLRKQVLSLKYTRKISTAIGMYAPALSLIGMCFVNCNSTLAVVLLCIAVATNSAKFSGGLVSEQDIAPNYSGVLKGFVNGTGAIMGIVAPMIIGLITTNNETLGAWRLVYAISAAAYIVGGTSYIIFGSVKIQKWNDRKGKGLDGL